MKNFHIIHKNFLSFLLGIILLLGFYEYNRMQTSLFPEITFPKIKIIADNGQQPVDKMMITVTKPLENAIKQVYDLSLIQSVTSRGTCELSAYFSWDANINLSQQMIESRISEIRNTLPVNTEITVEKMNPSMSPVMGYTLDGPAKSPIELKLIANLIARPFLSQVSGIASVRVLGGKTKEYWVEPDPQKMSSCSVTPEMISTALGQTNFISSNGYSYDYKRLYLNLTDAGIYSKEDLQNVVIRNDQKRIILLKDIAKIEIKEQVEYIRVNANGHDALLVNVYKQPNANLIEVSDAMQLKIAELNKTLPAGVILKPYYIQANFVKNSVKSVTDSLWMGLVLAIFVAILFLRSLKASLTILITIPVTICLTLAVLSLIHYNFNIMTLGAIAAAIGLIIDDAIVVVEQIHRTHEENPEEDTSVLIGKAIHFLFPSMLGSSISTIVIFIPFVLMGGVAGAYFNVLTNTMIITLVCSFFVTWIGLPVIYLRLSKKTPNVEVQSSNESNNSDVISSSVPINTIRKPSASKLNSAWISFFIKRPIISFTFIAGLIYSIWYIYPKLETGFLPEMDEGTIVFDYKSPPGTSLDETDRMMKEVEKMLVQIPEVEDYSRRTGAEMGFFITEPNKGDYLIQLKKDRKRTTEEVIDDIRQRVRSTQPALQIDFGQIIGDMLEDLLSSAKPIEVKVFGSDEKILTGLANDITAIVSSVKGTADVFNGIIVAGPEVTLSPNYSKLAQFDVSPANFQFQMQTQLEGNITGAILENQQMTSIRMVYPDSKNNGVGNVKQQFIFLPGGKLKPVTEFVNVNLKPGVAELRRENLQSVIDVSARLNGRDLGSVVKDIKKEIKAKLHLPSGYSISYAGASAEQEKSFHDLLIILISACLLVFAVILFLFRDFRVSLLIISMAVLGVAGSYMALYFTGTPLNVGSYTGLIMIIGIIGENAIFTFQQFSVSRQTSNVDEAIVYSISTRLRPKLMTALGAIIALMPLALGIGTGAQLHQPLAIAVIGGFIIALPLLLIVFPTLLRIIFNKK